MKVQDRHGNISEHKIPSSIRGLRIERVSLDRQDVKDLLNMHHEDIVSFLLLLDVTMRPKIKE